MSEGNRSIQHGDLNGAVATYGKAIDLLQTHYRYLEKAERKPSSRDLDVVRPLSSLIESYQHDERLPDSAKEISTAAAMLNDVFEEARDSGMDDLADELEAHFWKWRAFLGALEVRPTAAQGEPWIKTARREADYERDLQSSPNALLRRSEALLQSGDYQLAFFVADRAEWFFGTHMNGSNWLQFYPDGLVVLTSALGHLRKEHSRAAVLSDMMFYSWQAALEENSRIARGLSGQDLESFRVATVAAGTHVTQMRAEDLQNQSEPPRRAKDALAESVSMLDESINLAAKDGVALPEEMSNWHGSLPELSHLWN